MTGVVVLGAEAASYIDRHPDVSTTVLDGTEVRCRGCGHSHGLACVVISDDYVYVEPTFPFTEDDCPVCYWFDIALNGWPHDREAARSEPTGKPLGLDPARLP